MTDKSLNIKTERDHQDTAKPKPNYTVSTRNLR